MTTILGLKLINRSENAIELHNIITEFGCAIKTRIGLHKTDTFSCDENGIIILELVDNKSAILLENALLGIDNLTLSKMKL